MPTIDSVARYLKLRARAEHAGTPLAEAKVAKARIQEMESGDPELRDVAMRVAKVIAGDRGSKGIGAGWTGILQGILQDAVETGAEHVAGAMVGTHRYEGLRPREVKILRLDCASNQVCVEVRMRVVDARREGFLENVLDAIAEELEEHAEARR